MFDILAFISLLIVIMLLRRAVNIFPSLLACMIRWKENVNLEASLRLKTDRNMIAAAMVVPFCLLVEHTGLYFPSWMEGLGTSAGIFAILAVLGGYFLLRHALTFALRPRANASAYKTSSAASKTFFIILTFFLLATVGIFSLFDAGTEATRNAMIWISGAIYLVFIFRRVQIFASSYNFFAVFLYLCALEILPTGILIASALIF